MLFVPLTALQILWINFLGDGPPGLALALDRNRGVMARPPRPSNGGLLDPASTRFIVASGVFKGVIGMTALVVLPIVGFTLIAIQTVIFQSEAIGKLVSTYGARSLTGRAGSNLVLHGAVAAGLALQATTMTVGGLRALLGLSDPALPTVLAACAVIAVAVCGQLAIARIIGRAEPGQPAQPA
jgi:Ca2+-transporting ATPase